MIPAMAAAPRPTKSELAILRVLWERGPLPVRAVQSVLDAAKPTGYTTVLKLMQIMTDKGLLERDDRVPAHAIQWCFAPARPTGYTTVLKLMQIMTDKGLLERDDRVRPQVYKPRHKQEKTPQHLLRDFIDR